MADENPMMHLCGWRGVDATQKMFAAQFLPFAQAAPQLMGAPEPTQPILLYQAYKTALGSYPDYPAQVRGDCVSFGHGHGNDLLQCIEIGLGGPLVYQETDTEMIYGESRKVAGILRTGDGSYGSAAIKAMTTVGMVSRKMLGTNGVYDGSRVDDWGHHGPPSDVEKMAGGYLLGSGAGVTSWDEGVAALQNGYPWTECSNFLPGQARDKDGFVRPSGSGGHCQLVVGVRFDRPGICILNSWGSDYYSGPIGLDAPPYAYWIDRDVAEKWIFGTGDNWALSKSPAFETRVLPPDWNWHDAS